MFCLKWFPTYTLIFDFDFGLEFLLHWKLFLTLLNRCLRMYKTKNYKIAFKTYKANLPVPVQSKGDQDLVMVHFITTSHSKFRIKNSWGVWYLIVDETCKTQKLIEYLEFKKYYTCVLKKKLHFWEKQALKRKLNQMIRQVASFFFNLLTLNFKLSDANLVCSRFLLSNNNKYLYYYQ